MNRGRPAARNSSSRGSTVSPGTPNTVSMPQLLICLTMYWATLMSTVMFPVNPHPPSRLAVRIRRDSLPAFEARRPDSGSRRTPRGAR